MLLALVLSAMPIPSPAPQATPLYPCTSYPAGEGPRVSAVCDFDRDGHLDVLVGNARGVDILRGDGTGRLKPKRPLLGMPTGDVAELAIADLNGDGWLDVAALRGKSYHPKRLSIAVSDQAGGVTPIFTSERSNLSGLLSGDLDTDGRSELVLRVPGPNPTLVVRSNAVGGVQLLRLNVGTPWLLADIDGDGADEAFSTPTGSNTSLMYSGFSPAGWTVSTPVPFARPYLANVADVDFDGDLELLLRYISMDFLTIVDFPANAPVSVRDVDFADGDTSFPVVLGDYDGDGRIDLLVSTWSRPKVLLDVAGTGPFQLMPYYGYPDTVWWGPGSPPPEPIRVGDAGTDLNEDGADDVVFLGGDLFGVMVTLSDGQGALAVEASAMNHTRPMVAGDVNGDSHQDLLVNDEFSFHVLLGDGQGQLALHCTVPFPTSYFGFGSRLLDWEGDGDLDLLVEFGELRVHLNDGSGCFSAAQITPLPGGYLEVFGHFDGDAFRDAIAPDGSLYRGNGLGGFHPPVPTNIQLTLMNWPVVASLGDIDGDGLDDVVAGYLHSPPRVYLGSANGSFIPHVTLAFHPDHMVGGDFNGDGNRDVAWVGQPAWTAELGVMYGDGAGGFSAPVTMDVHIWPEHFLLTAMDLNNDGRDDLIDDGLTFTGNVSRADIYHALPTGGFERVVGPVVVGFQLGNPVADFNSDGFADFAVAEFALGSRVHTRMLLSR